MRFGIGVRRFGANVAYAVSTPRRALATALVAAGTSVVLAASAYPSFAVRMLVAGPTYWEHTLRMLFFVLVEGAGPLGVALVALYALLTGVLTVVVARQLRTIGPSGLLSVSGALPGLLASGCASCGAGLLGLVGVTGAVAALPFHGNGLRALGIAVLGVLLARTGDPQRCGLSERGS